MWTAHSCWLIFALSSAASGVACEQGFRPSLKRWEAHVCRRRLPACLRGDYLEPCYRQASETHSVLQEGVVRDATTTPRAGEAYDKVARLMGLDMQPNGGACLEALARGGDPARFHFRTPMQKQASLADSDPARCHHQSQRAGFRTPKSGY